MDEIALSGNGAFFYRLASDAANNSHKEKALVYIDKVLATDPKYSMAWQVKGNCLDSLGRFQEALECYDTAIGLDPCNSETWFNKGLTLKNLGQEKEANECMARAVKLALGE